MPRHANAVRILVADDHAVVRRGIEQILSDAPDLHVGGEALDAPQALDLVREQVWDLVVLDLNLPGSTGLEVLNEIKLLRPQLPVLILTMHSEELFGLRAPRGSVRIPDQGERS